MDECRKAFEDWRGGYGVYPQNLKTECNGEYSDSFTQLAWSSWKAAWDHPNRNKHSETSVRSGGNVAVDDKGSVLREISSGGANSTQNRERQRINREYWDTQRALNNPTKTSED